MYVDFGFLFLVIIIFLSNSINIKKKLCYFVVVSSFEKENAPEGPTQKGLREAREQNKCKTKMKDNTKV